MSDDARQPLHIVLDNVRSAFNVGSVFRSADGCAAEHLYLCGMTCAPPHPRLARTALGAADHVPWTWLADPLDAVAALRDRGIPLVAVESTPEARPLFAFDWPRPVALVFGHEVRGIAPDVLAACAAAVRIPMLGHKRTLNVSTACGIVLYETLRNWGAFASPPQT